MANKKRLIWDVDMKTAFREWFDHEDFRTMNQVIDDIPTVDAVEVDTIRAWLYEMAMNNTDNYLCNACEEIISRLDGLIEFEKDGRRE